MKNKIETGSRNVKQTFRKFTMADRQKIVDHVESLPYGMKTKVLFDLNLKTLYYTWEKRYPHLFKKNQVKETQSSNVKMTSVVHEKSTRNVMSPVNTIHVRKITVEVDIKSVDVLFNTIREINKIKGVKSVTA